MSAFNNKEALDEAVEGLRRGLDGPTMEESPNSHSVYKLAPSDSHTVSLLDDYEETYSNGSKPVRGQKLKNGSNGLHELLSLESSESINNSLEDEESGLLNDENGEKKPKTLFEPLKEGSKDKDWGKPSAATIGRLLSLGRSEFWKILVATIALLIGSLANLVLPKLIGGVMDTITKDGLPSLKLLMVKLAILFTVIAICSWIRQTLFGMAGEKIVAKLRQTLFDKLLTMEVAFYDVNRTGELVNRLSSDTTMIQNTVTSNVSQGLRNLALVIGGMIILFTISWKLTMIMFVILPLLAGIAFGYGKFIRALSKKVQDVLAAATTVAEETLGSMRTVKSFGSEGKESDKYKDKINESYRVAKKRTIVDGAFEAVVGLIINVCLGGILFFGGWLVIKEELTAGVLTSYVLYVLQAAVGFVALSALFADFMRAMGASDRVFELLDRVPTVRHEGGEYPNQMEGRVEFKNVDFTYPSRLDHPVLNQLSLHLQPGKNLALVGPSGGGKSTTAHLLLGLYYPTAGQVLIDGKVASDLDPNFLREHIAVVSQEPSLFACSILDNIAYGVSEKKFFSPQDKQRQVEEAAKMANAHDFIEGFPEGYETMVGERGIRLSGGQKQRIAIARALLKKPKILILDEATSALDSESEHLVKEALDSLLANEEMDRAYLVIAHRLSTVKNAHEVAVVVKGHVVERGTHEELLALNGTYKQLVSRQLSQD